ncbi:MAG: hypothetical protein OEM62_07185 [Acidobacteriota bacterium]|nr:hypothetical protein [Acidobacteriota bacterium]
MKSSPTVNSLLSAASDPVRRQLRIASETARRHGVSAWLVGGAVRDLMLPRESHDLDLVVIGGWLPFASDLSNRLGGRLARWPRFLTAGFVSKEGWGFDVVRARSEVYACVAGLPRVRPGTLREDLFRRDFTVNAMALRLTGSGGALADPFGGERDLGRRRLRILHDHSFVDDPGRIFRGIYMASRLGLHFEARTSKAAADAVAAGTLAQLSRQRLRAGLELVLTDPVTAASSIETLVDFGVDCVLHPALAWGDATRRRLRRLAGGLVEVPIPRRWLVSLLVLTWDLKPSEHRDVLRRLGFGEHLVKQLVAAREAAHRVSRRLETLDSAYERFTVGESLDPVARALAACCGKAPVRSFLDSEWQTLQAKRLQLRGQDLVQLGFAPGPLIGRGLEATLRARMDGRISGSEEAAYATRWLQARDQD